MTSGGPSNPALGAHGVVGRERRVCAKCLEPAQAGTKLRHCGACELVSYCNAACQRAHWPAHKLPCQDEVVELAAKAAMIRVLSR